jgi:hypothetical protein
MTRYFIVFFTGITSNGENVQGDVAGTTKNGKYVSKDKLVKNIQQVYSVEDVCITNVVELNENDHKEWLSVN